LLVLGITGTLPDAKLKGARQRCPDTLLERKGRKTKAKEDQSPLEVSRVATDGVRNGCSMLYGACRRAALALGYRRLVTYVLDTEPGTSLRAAGWRCTGAVRGKPWDTPRRRRVDRHPIRNKYRWEAGAA
jgi:hypothetical protein